MCEQGRENRGVEEKGGGARRSRARIGGEMGLGLVAPEISGEGEGGGGWSAAVGRRKKGRGSAKEAREQGSLGVGFCGGSGRRIAGD